MLKPEKNGCTKKCLTKTFFCVILQKKERIMKRKPSIFLIILAIAMFLRCAAVSGIWYSSGAFAAGALLVLSIMGEEK